MQLVGLRGTVVMLPPLFILGVTTHLWARDLCQGQALIQTRDHIIVNGIPITLCFTCVDLGGMLSNIQVGFRYPFKPFKDSNWCRRGTHANATLIHTLTAPHSSTPRQDSPCPPDFPPFQDNLTV